MYLSFSELTNLCCVAIEVGGHSEQLQWVAGDCSLWPGGRVELNHRAPLHFLPRGRLGLNVDFISTLSFESL